MIAPSGRIDRTQHLLDSRSQVSQPQRARAADQVIQVGDIIMGRVTRINTRQASVEIICVGETVLREPHRGIIRKEVCGLLRLKNFYLSKT